MADHVEASKDTFAAEFGDSEEVERDMEAIRRVSEIKRSPGRLNKVEELLRKKEDDLADIRRRGFEKI